VIVSIEDQRVFEDLFGSLCPARAGMGHFVSRQLGMNCDFSRGEVVRVVWDRRAKKNRSDSTADQNGFSENIRDLVSEEP
jgi:hypothetical protein